MKMTRHSGSFRAQHDQSLVGPVPIAASQFLDAMDKSKSGVYQPARITLVAGVFELRECLAIRMGSPVRSAMEACNPLGTVDS